MNTTAVGNAQYFDRDSRPSASSMAEEMAKSETSKGGGPNGLVLWGLAVALVVAAGAGAAWWWYGSKAVGDQVLPETVAADMTLAADSTVTIDDITYVAEGVTLTIEPGATLLGLPGSALVVARGGKLVARGTARRPIVFTSYRQPGQRSRGDWGGVVLLGAAPINRGIGQIEGLPESDLRNRFGGEDSTSSCGVLEHVRVEFAGHTLRANNELNGLTLGGCGSGTVIANVQVHMGLDDGLEIFGGTVNIRNVLISRPGDDGLDWDMGWTGKAQNVIVQLDRDMGDAAIEADNDADSPDAEPRSAPQIYNLTLVGGRLGDNAQRGMVLRRGTAGQFHNVLVAGFRGESIDIRDASTVAAIKSKQLSFDGMIISNSGTVEGAFLPEQGDNDDDGGFNEEAYFRRLPRVSLTQDPGFSNRIYSVTSPSFVPAPRTQAAKLTVAVPQGEFWDESAQYLGAIRPGNNADWTQRWTAFPTD